MPTPRAFKGRSASNNRPTSSAGSEAEGSSRTSRLDSTASARDRDERFLGAREVAHAHRRIERAIDLRERRGRRGLGGGPIDHAALAGKADRERDILDDRHPFDEAEILVNERDGLALAEFRRPMLVGLALIEDFAARRLENARQQLDERRLPRAVFAQQREDFARAHVERHAAQRDHAAEALRDVAKADQGLRFWGRPVGHSLSDARGFADPRPGFCYR